MSLNGLDDNSVTEAHITALGEAGGWFLLKYASRDSVQVFTRGSGGVAEARAAIAQYEEKSPLYGFLLYRRRKVLIKYMPDGTSRLLQARVAVHFTTITEKFTPHDAVVSITTPDELSDAALTSACSLHTAAPSSSSSSGSSRQNKLSWIREDAEESTTAGEDKDKDKETAAEKRPTTASSSIPATIQEPAPQSDGTSEETITPVQEVAQPQPQPQSQPAPTPTPGPAAAAAAVDKDIAEPRNEPKAKPTIEISNASTDAAVEEHDQPGQKPAASAPAQQESFKNYDSLFEDGPDPRLSSQTARPTYNELYAEYYAMYSKPKVKLGPRPRPSLDGKRPHTSGSGTQSTATVARPVSSLPPGLRSGNKKGSNQKRTTRDKTAVPTIAVPPPPPIPAVPDIPHSPMHAPKSPASVRSMPIPSYSSHHKSSGITPEKQRLMKALELRKKQMKAQKEKEAKKVAEPIVQPEPEADADIESGDTTPTEATAVEKVEPVDTQISATAKPEEQLPALEEKEKALAPEKDVEKESEKEIVKETERQAPAPEAAAPAPVQDELAVAHAETDDLTSTASACSPISAQTQGSSGAPSTRPSSMSEDGHQVAGEDQKIAQQAEAEVESGHVQTPVATSRNEDEQESIESSPTVVPESNTPIPSVEVTSQPEDSLTRSEPASSPISSEDASVSDDALIRRNKRESVIYMPLGDQDDAQSRRRSKRESMIFMPSGDVSQSDASSQTKKKNRESMIMPAFNRHSFLETKEKRKTLLDPVSTLSAENSEAEYLSDDSFMEELQSAKVQEAKPILVSKSPTAALFPRKAQWPEVPLPERSVSQQYNNRSSSLSPEQAGRKSSGPWLPHANTDSVVVTAKKINVSSGISQRIKALAEKSNRESTASVSSLATPDSRGSIVAQRKSSFFATPPSGNSPNGKSVQRLSRASFANLSSNPTTPDRKSVSQPPPLTSESAVYNVQRAPEKPESVQVTARIVRDAGFMAPPLTMPDGNTPLDLHPSPITINHQKANPTPKSPVKELSSSRPPSSSQSQDLSAIALPRSSSESSWRSFGRRMSESKSVHSIESGDERKEKKDKKDKKDSRTSKLFKRMSSISSISRKNSSASGQGPELHSTSLPSLREPPPPVQIGDLNIQFPDTLLWKRRWVEIDMMGNLVLSPSKSNEKGIIKRFHLTEFRTPYAPDQDRQELPNSVVLDFLDGRTLQCACETYAAQGQVLQILREAQDAWLAYSQRQ